MIRVLFLGENVNTLTGGIVTVMKQILNDEEIGKSVYYDVVYTTSNTQSVLIKIKDWITALLKFVFKVRKCNLIHIHHASNANFWLSGIMVYVASFANRNVILHNHAGDFFMFYNRCNSIKKGMIKNILKKASVNVVLSETWLEKYEKLEPLAKWKVLPNSVVVNELVKEDNLEIDVIKLIYIGRIEIAKGILDLVSILDKIYEVSTNFEIFIAGSGNTDLITDISSKQPWSNNIKLLGFINSKQRDKLLTECDIFILPSYHEGLPMSLLEAMAHGVVPIATSVGGIPEVIKSGVNGFLLEPGNRKLMLDSILKLIANKRLLNEMSVNSYRTVKEKYNFVTYRERLLSLYKVYSNAA